MKKAAALTEVRVLGRSLLMRDCLDTRTNIMAGLVEDFYK